MKKFLLITFMVVLAGGIPLAAETAVLPYHVENPSEYLTVEQGKEHAWCVASAAAMTRRVEILPWRELEEDMKGRNPRPGTAVSPGDMAAFAKKRYLQYVVTGTLERTGKFYHSRGMLYSVKDDRIVERCENRAADLLTLAERDADDLFARFPRARKTEGGALDVALVFDSSLSMVKEWTSLREAGRALASVVLEKLALDTRIYLVPYSDQVGPAERSVAVRSVAEIDRGLARIRPRGEAKGTHLDSALRFAVNGIHWRNDASHLIVVIANSPGGKGSGAERYTLTAARKGISVCTLTLGGLDGEEGALFRRMAEMGRGDFHSVSYHQRIFDQKGDGQEIYFQRGRFFRSSVYSGEWKDGLLGREGAAGSFGEPLRFLDEIYFRDRGLLVNAYNLPDSLNRTEGIVVLRSDPLENNLAYITTRMMEGYASPEESLPAGKVLLSQNRVSIWVRPADRSILDRLKEYEAGGVYITLGCRVMLSPDDAYGITLLPLSVLGPGEFVPGIVRADLEDVVRRKDHYMRSGFLDPPVWYIRVKVDRLEYFGRKSRPGD